MFFLGCLGFVLEFYLSIKVCCREDGNFSYKEKMEFIFMGEGGLWVLEFFSRLFFEIVIVVRF